MTDQIYKTGMVLAASSAILSFVAVTWIHTLVRFVLACVKAAQ